MHEIFFDTPSNYLELANEHAKKGRYVLALGTRRLKHNENLYDRREIERDLKFLALLVFENACKPDSPAAIQEIQAGGIRTILCTGDHEPAAIACARDVGIMKVSYKIYLKFSNIFWVFHAIFLCIQVKTAWKIKNIIFF